MGTQNYLWHFILSVFLCTLMASEGRDTTTATADSHLNVSRSTNNSSTTGPAAISSEPDTSTAHSLLGTTLLSPSSMRIMGAEGTMSTTPTTKMQEGGSLGVSAKSSAFQTAGTGTTTAPSMGTETGTASSPPLSSATRSHSSSSSPGGSSPVPPSPQQSSTSSTTEAALATTSHPATALESSPSSTAGSAQLSPGTETQGPATPTPVAPTSPASGTVEARPSPSAGSSTGTPTPRLSSTALSQGQPSVQGTAASRPTGSPSPSTATASAGSRATTPPGEGESSTMNQGDRTTTETSHFLSATSLVSTMTTVGGEGRMDTAPTTKMSERASLGTSPRSAAVSPAFPTAGTGTTAAPESGTASSLSFSSATRSHSSSSSPGGSSPVPPSPQQSSTSSTTGMPLATTSHPATALVLSTARVTDVGSDTVTAEQVTRSPASSTASTNPVAPASETTAPNHSPTAGSSTGTPTPRLSSTALSQGQPSVQGTAASPPTGRPSPSTATASAGSRATTPPGEGESSTMNQGIRTTEPTANTSHSLPATSLATPSMTNLSTSTSVNPSFTTTCWTVSIEVQNVTGEEIELSWSSSSKGSLYIISVRNGEEIHTRTTNETETVIKDLLPGHVYTISVALSSCADNNPASVTVQTDSDSCFKRTEFCSAQSTGCSYLKGIVCSNNQAFACRVWLTNETFNNTLYNSDSEDYVALTERLRADVVEEMHAELGNSHSDILVLGLRPGSVIADFLFLLPKEEARDVGDIQTRLSNVLRSKFGSQSKVQTLSVQSSTDNSSSWRGAVIVLGVLLGVALVLILLAVLFYIHVRRRSGIYFE